MNGLKFLLISISFYLSDVTNSNFISCASVLHDMGLCQIRLSQLDEAEEIFTESLRIAQSLRPEEHQGLQISSSKICQQVSLCDDILISIVFLNLVKNLLGLVRMLKYFRTLD